MARVRRSLLLLGLFSTCRGGAAAPAQPAPIAAAPAQPAARQRPHLFVFLADDLLHGEHGIGFTGNTHVTTPHLDEFAAHSLQFTRMYTSVAMCAPSRATLYTGLHPARSGCTNNHCHVKDDVVTLPSRLRDLGYTNVLGGKIHVRPPRLFPFEIYAADKEEDTAGRVAASSLQALVDDKLAADAGALHAPWLIVLSSHEPHASHEPDPLASNTWVDHFNTTEMLPKWPDSAETRAELFGMYNDINKMDREYARFRDALNRNFPKADRPRVTIVLSDHGGKHFAKWSAYEAGLHVPCFVQTSGLGLPARSGRVDYLVSFVDVVPTFIELAGGDLAEGATDGTSLVPLLAAPAGAETKAVHDYVFGTHTARGVRCVTNAYPIRSVSDGRWKYIHNFNARASFQNNMLVNTKSGEWDLWLDEQRRDGPNGKYVGLMKCRPGAELYDLERDPSELNNVFGMAKETAARAAIIRLRRALAGHMIELGDLDPLAQEEGLPMRLDNEAGVSKGCMLTDATVNDCDSAEFATPSPAPSPCPGARPDPVFCHDGTAPNVCRGFAGLCPATCRDPSESCPPAAGPLSDEPPCAVADTPGGPRLASADENEYEQQQSLDDRHNTLARRLRNEYTARGYGMAVPPGIILTRTLVLGQEGVTTWVSETECGRMCSESSGCRGFSFRMFLKVCILTTSDALSGFVTKTTYHQTSKYFTKRPWCTTTTATTATITTTATTEARTTTATTATAPTTEAPTTTTTTTTTEPPACAPLLNFAEPLAGTKGRWSANVGNHQKKTRAQCAVLCMANAQGCTSFAFRTVPSSAEGRQVAATTSSCILYSITALSRRGNAHKFELFVAENRCPTTTTTTTTTATTTRSCPDTLDQQHYQTAVQGRRGRYLKGTGNSGFVRLAQELPCNGAVQCGVVCSLVARCEAFSVKEGGACLLHTREAVVGSRAGLLNSPSWTLHIKKNDERSALGSFGLPQEHTRGRYLKGKGLVDSGGSNLVIELAPSTEDPSSACARACVAEVACAGFAVGLNKADTKLTCDETPTRQTAWSPAWSLSELHSSRAAAVCLLHTTHGVQKLQQDCSDWLYYPRRVAYAQPTVATAPPPTDVLRNPAYGEFDDESFWISSDDDAY